MLQDEDGGRAGGGAIRNPGCWAPILILGAGALYMCHATHYETWHLVITMCVYTPQVCFCPLSKYAASADMPPAKHVPGLVAMQVWLVCLAVLWHPATTQACSAIGLCALLAAPSTSSHNGEPPHAPLFLFDAQGRTVAALQAPGEPVALAVNTTHVYVTDKV